MISYLPTIAKAVAAYLVTFIVSIASQYGITETTTLTEMVDILVNAAISAIAVAYAVWYVPNKDNDRS